MDWHAFTVEESYDRLRSSPLGIGGRRAGLHRELPLGAGHAVVLEVERLFPLHLHVEGAPAFAAPVGLELVAPRTDLGERGAPQVDH